MKRDKREVWEAMNVSNVICQEDNDDEDGEIFFHKWKELKTKRSMYILNLIHEISFYYI